MDDPRQLCKDVDALLRQHDCRGIVVIVEGDTIIGIVSPGEMTLDAVGKTLQEAKEWWDTDEDRYTVGQVDPLIN